MIPNAKKPSLLVLAAGMGSRYGGLKQTDAVGPHGETLMDYSVYDAMRAGIGKVVFVIREAMEKTFREQIGRRFEKDLEVAYVFQELDRLPAGYTVPLGRTKPWGTTHAVLMAADVIDGLFAVINADDFYGAEGYRLLVECLKRGKTADVPEFAMVGFVLRNTLSEFGPVARGVCRVSPDNLLRGVEELTGIEGEGVQANNVDANGEVRRLTGDEIVSMNMWGLTSDVFALLENYFKTFLDQQASNATAECYLPSGINALVTSGEARVRVLSTTARWIGMTYREDHARVVEYIEGLVTEGRYPERLWK